MHPKTRAALLHVAILLLVLVMIASHGAPALANQPAGQSSSLSDMDLSVDPGVDFYRYANGGWLDRAVIPADFPAWSTMTFLDGQTRLQLIELLETQATDPTLRAGSDTWKAARLYQQGVDLEARNESGLAPIQGTLNQIEAISDFTQLDAFLETSVLLSVPGFFPVTAGPDVFDGRETEAYLGGPTLGLPDREYYLAEDAARQPVQRSYIDTMAKLLSHSGVEVGDARSAAERVFAFEANLAAATWSVQESSDFSRILVKASLYDLVELYPEMDWPGYFQAIGLEADHVFVIQERYMAGLADLLRATPLEVVKDYLALQLLWSASSALDDETESIAFAYLGGALNGIATQAPIEGRILDQVNALFGDALGQMYVAEYFSPESRQQGEHLAHLVVDAFRTRLEANEWMTPNTRNSALKKLDALKIKVGYPDTWDSYEGVKIGDSYFDSALSAFTSNYLKGIAKIGNPIDRDAWPFPPQTVNAMYNPANNEIVVPAAVLQAPLFDADGDIAANLGAIGFVIGHEITHGFDIQGAQFNGDGILSNWWSPEDAANFTNLNEEVVAQYDGLSVEGIALDGDRTLAENVADLGGIQVAYEALQHEMASGNASSLPDDRDFSTAQRFFIAAATVWRSSIRSEALATQLATDTHAPSVIRAVQPLRNCDAFYDAFDIGPGDPMYLPPSERVEIW